MLHPSVGYYIGVVFYEIVLLRMEFLAIIARFTLVLAIPASFNYSLLLKAAMFGWKLRLS